MINLNPDCACVMFKKTELRRLACKGFYPPPDSLPGGEGPVAGYT
ncbi:hypothetical protein EMIT0P253_10406 [Pseudomonas sp. IT-P253]